MKVLVIGSGGREHALVWKLRQRLSADQVYALTAFLLHQNEIIQENDVIDRNSLPKIQMPNRNGFVPDPRPE